LSEYLHKSNPHRGNCPIVSSCTSFGFMPISTRIRLSRQAARQIQTGIERRPLLAWKRLGDRRVFVGIARRSCRASSKLQTLAQRGLTAGRAGPWSTAPHISYGARMQLRSCSTVAVHRYAAMQVACEVAALERRRVQPDRFLQRLRSSLTASARRTPVTIPAEYMGLLASVRTFPRRQPFQTNLIISVTGYSAADYSTQRCSGEPIDGDRLANFALFGLVQGCVAWTFFVRVVSKLIPTSLQFSTLSFKEKMRDRAGQLGVVKQVCLDNFAYTPFVFFPTFYSCKALVKGDSRQQALERYKENFLEDNIVSCKVWLWADLLIFGVPPWIRMPIFQAVNFGYMIVLSSMRGNSAESKPELNRSEIIQSDHFWQLNRWLNIALLTPKLSYNSF